jgi:hypothetical protein
MPLRVSGDASIFGYYSYMMLIAVTACVEYRILVSGASSNYTAVSNTSGYRYKFVLRLAEVDL